jgi:hypothetical protein
MGIKVDQLDLDGVDRKIADNFQKLGKALTYNAIETHNALEEIRSRIKDVFIAAGLHETANAYVFVAITGVPFRIYSKLLKIAVDEVMAAGEQKRVWSETEIGEFAEKLIDRLKKKYDELIREEMR